MPAETVCAVVVEFFFAVARLTRTARLEMKCPCVFGRLGEKCRTPCSTRSSLGNQPSVAARDTSFARTLSPSS